MTAVFVGLGYHNHQADLDSPESPNYHTALAKIEYTAAALSALRTMYVFCNNRRRKRQQAQACMP